MPTCTYYFWSSDEQKWRQLGFGIYAAEKFRMCRKLGIPTATVYLCGR